ncbi:hypothetical protein [Streptomyces genisteinicus]|uniref:Uncharacterized protein n=1 Tax=Streptomyces genisteinicus TaxID=2768068 RepID=A0A7H0HUK9_9ACTN|nr:hypothetical protein [Streptomyces genisteinicus]QNP64225.1 hypothetical protein IAG43_15810 [Streptomyces genisteinicus]
MKRQRGRTRPALAGIAAACAVAVLPAPAAAAPEPGPYAFDRAAKPVSGTAVNTNGPSLQAGSVYKDRIGAGEKRYYRIDLDAVSNAYVSAVAVPEPATAVTYADELSVSVENRSGTACSEGEARFGSAAFPRPVADYASRRVDKESSTCQEAGTYYVLLERKGEAAASPEPWEVEIRFVTEPGLSGQGPTAAPDNWPSASPAAPAGGPVARAGGNGFHDATGLTQGEWQDEIRPGRTLFYRVPVDWGRQLFVSADLGSSTAADPGSVSNALVVALHNPALGLVDEESGVYYDGKQKTLALDPLPPVAHENRYDSDSTVSAMRFAGWYYLSVTLSPEIAGEFGDGPLPLTLRVNVEGDARSGPAYDGPAGDFQVTDDDREAADSGRNAAEEADGATMRVVAAAGIGTGTLLVLALGLWTLLARRGAAARGQDPVALPAQAQAVPGGAPAGGPAGYGYPQGQGASAHRASAQDGPGQGHGYGGFGPPPGQ